VLDVEPVLDAKGKEIESGLGAGKYLLAELTLARVKDFGVNDEQFMVRSHLGRVLQPGDLAWGFDMATSQFNDECVSTPHFPFFFLSVFFFSFQQVDFQKNWPPFFAFSFFYL
jgi:hypothetical protein